MRSTMKNRKSFSISKAILLWAALILAPALLTACQHDDVVAPAGTSVDDNGSGGSGSDDPPGDDHGNHG